MRHGPQAPHDPADPERVGDGLAQTEAFGHLEIGDRAGIVAADLEADDDEIGAVEGRALVGVGLDFGRHVDHADHPAHHGLALGEAFGIDVHQPDRGARKRLAVQDVACDVAGEHGAARADEGDRCHVAISNAARTSRLV